MIAMLRNLLARQNRLQRSTKFKVIATIVASLGAIALLATYLVVATAPAASGGALAERLIERQEAIAAEQGAEGAEVIPGGSRPALESILRRVDRLREAREDKLNVVLGSAVLLGIVVVIIWLGLALTYLELLLATWLVSLLLLVWHLIFPFSSLDTAHAIGRMLRGMVALAAAFTALIEGVRVLFGLLPGTVFAVARNTVVEAVRMKVSVIFIILLIFALAALPGMLNEASPLRYRVQSFLQYGTGGSFWIIAILTLFFSAATVAFEQRDRQIWQTMTKPVAPWQYLLGKWLGVAGVSATLLLVSTTGVFLFTEYLRAQPAQGERARQAAGILAPSEDRETLETQILVARKAVEPEVPPEISARGEQFQAAVDDFIEKQRIQDPDFATDPAQREQVEKDLAKGIFQMWRSIEPGASEGFEFDHLERAAATGAPVILRYRVDAGSNAPDQTFRLTFRIQGQPFIVREAGLGHMSTMTIAPLIVIPHAEHWHAVLMDEPEFYDIIAAGFPDNAQLLQVEDLIQDGKLLIEILNGDAETMQGNPETIMLPAGGLELTYAVGSYRMNYLRVVAVLWLKLLFLSMLGITCATFLSFPVACLVAFGTFLAAESAGFLGDSLPYYDATTREGGVIFYKVVVRGISLAVAGLFRVYADLRPTSKLVEGQLVGWWQVGLAGIVLGIWSLILYVIGVLLFRRRELAIYSGS